MPGMGRMPVGNSGNDKLAEASGKGWLDLTDIRNAGYRSAAEPYEVSLGAIGSSAYDFRNRTIRRIVDVLAPKQLPSGAIPLIDSAQGKLDASRTSMQEHTEVLVAETLIDMGDDGRKPRISVEALMKMIEEGYLIPPEVEASKSWAKDELRTPKSTEEPSPSPPRRR